MTTITDFRPSLLYPTQSSIPTKGPRTQIQESELPTMVPETQLDFNSLPPALRRKYFSTLERLRFASAGDSTSLPKNGRIGSQLGLRKKSRAPHHFRQSSSTTFRRSKARRLRRARSVKEDYIAAQIDARWFLSLPSKIQRKHFTREEQVLLAGNQDTIILDAADEKLYRLGNRVPAPQRSWDSLSDSPTIPSNSSWAFSDEDDEEAIIDSAVDMEESGYDGFRWLDDDDDLDLSLDDYHTHIAQTTQSEVPTLTGKRRPSFRRKLSINSLTFGRSSTASWQPPRSSRSSMAPNTTPHLHSHRRSNSRPISILTPRHDPQNSISTIEPSAKHYQDPEARLKLRVYLASPQKFDEAIEFGFPSLAKENIPPATAPGSGSQDRTFLDDADNTSLIQNDTRRKSEGDSSSDDDSPFTPVDSAFASAKTSKNHSVDVTPSFRPRILHKPSDSYVQSSTATREMTLHMTLTRPDLRSITSEAANKRAATNSDPDALRLADLPFSDDKNSIWASMPPSEGKMRRMWKKLRGRTL